MTEEYFIDIKNWMASLSAISKKDRKEWMKK